MRYTFSGPGDGLTGGPTIVEAASELDARHLAMVKRWGKPNGRPAKDVDKDGRYLSKGLDLKEVRE